MRRAAPGLLALGVALAGLGVPRVASAWQVNGKVWPEMPIPIWVNPAGAPEFAGAKDGTDLILLAAGVWEDVACATISFQFMGETDAQFERDGKNVIHWVDDGWPWGDSAAGSTLWWQTEPGPDGEPMEVDLALNAEGFAWVLGGGDAKQSTVVDPISVVTHELGHVLGLAHSEHQFSTMYQALLPNGVQATLAADDKHAICSIYPSGQGECATDDDCFGGVCVTEGGLSVCDDRHARAGDPCSKYDLDCEGMCFISLFECSSICAFTNEDFTDGYCAPLCDGHRCPEGWLCVETPVTVGELVSTLSICQPDPDWVPPPDPGPEPSPEPSPEPAPETPPEPTDDLAVSDASGGGGDPLEDIAPALEPAPPKPASSGCEGGTGARLGWLVAALGLVARRRRT